MKDPKAQNGKQSYLLLRWGRQARSTLLQQGVMHKKCINMLANEYVGRIFINILLSFASVFRTSEASKSLTTPYIELQAVSNSMLNNCAENRCT